MKGFLRRLLLLMLAAVPYLVLAIDRNVPHLNKRVSSQNNQLQLLGHLRKRPYFLLGLSLKSDQLTASKYPCVVRNMNLMVPEYELKWDAIQRNQGEWDWSGADKLFQWAHTHGKLARGHTALWDQSVPNWVKNLNGDKKRMGDAIYAFVYASVRRYGHRMVSFDVVNEPIAPDTTGNLVQSVYWQTLGYEMFSIAYGAANQAKIDMKSSVKLYINEFNIEGTNVQNSGKKREGFLRLLAVLRRMKVPIQGVGLQSHFRSDMFPKNLEAGIKVFTDLKYEVSLTELDIRIKKNDYSAATLELQASQYAQTYQACLKNPRCVSVVRWDLDDSQSWVGKNFDDGFDRPTMFESGCKPKTLIMNKVIDVLKQF